jgi:DNA-directed RNA polymerase specialized sigma24 family protein
MTRIEHIKRRLEAWSQWRAKGGQGGMTSPLVTMMKYGTTIDAVREGYVPVDESECYETERAVNALPKDLRDTVLIVYTRSGTQEEFARRRGVTLSTLKNHLARSDRNIEQWLQERRPKR